MGACVPIRPVRRERRAELAHRVADGLEVIADAREQAERWCSALWGDREGWALTAVGRSPQMSSGRFRHTRLDHLPYWWPDDRDRLLSELLPLADSCDVYVAPLLRSAPNRRTADSEPLDGQYVWLELTSGTRTGSACSPCTRPPSCGCSREGHRAGCTCI